MSLKVREVAEIIEEYAPIKLKEDYDNVGLMVGDKNCEVSSILIALDCTMDVIKEAVERNCNLIITHHPLLFRKPAAITTDTLQGRKIIELITNKLNLYSCHTNLDSTYHGLNDLVCRILGYTQTEIIEKAAGMESESGIGRIIRLQETISLEKLCSIVKSALGLSSLRYGGEENKIIQSIAVINGSGQDYFAAAAARGVDCIITGDTTYHYVSDFTEDGIAVIDAGHFGTEWPAFKLAAEILNDRLAKRGFLNMVIISEKTEDPYKYK